jgi:hypothetical protein
VATTDAGSAPGTATPEGLAGRDLLTAREVATFGAAVGLFGIFYDASIAHGLFWENGPYWTYWTTPRS